MEFQAYVICDAQDGAAIGLKKTYGKSSEIAVYVKKVPHSWVQEAVDNLAEHYALLRVRTSGCGYSFGTATEDALDPDVPGQPIPVEAENLVLDSKDGHILGYCYAGEVFLPLNGGYREVDYEYHYQVFPTDGTASEYSCTTYARLESKQ